MNNVCNRHYPDLTPDPTLRLLSRVKLTLDRRTAIFWV
jgi:hypothetical protein